MLRHALVAMISCAILVGAQLWRSRPTEARTQALQGVALARLMGTAHIVPANAFADDSLHIRMDGAVAADYDAIAVTWFRNGREIEGYAMTELAPEYFQKGDQLEADVHVRAPMPGETIQSVATNVVYVANTPPRIVESTVSVDGTYPGQLIAHVQAVDADNDVLEFSYTWYLNGVEVPDAYGETFDVARCQAGDQVQTLIAAWDGDVESPVHPSPPIRITATTMR